MNPEEVMDDLALTNDDLALTNDDLPLDNDDLPLNNDDLPLSDDDLPLSDDDLRVSDDEEFVGYIVDSSDDDELAGEYNGLRTHQSDQTLPCVIPQTTKSLRGTNYSPFIRAYAPDLQVHNISQNDFLAFIDGLNECYVAHPIFQGLGMAGTAMGIATTPMSISPLAPVHWAGLGLRIASDISSGATSMIRTRAYLDAMNKTMWHPAGLHCNIMTTSNMMKQVKYPGDRLRLPPLDSIGDLEGDIEPATAEPTRTELTSTTQDDPRMRRIRALHGYVMPITLNVPAAVMPDNLFKKLNATQNAWLGRRHDRKQDRRRSKSEQRDLQSLRKHDEMIARNDDHIEKLESELAAITANFEKRVALKPDDTRAEQRSRRSYDKEKEKMERKMEEAIAKADKQDDMFHARSAERQANAMRREENATHKVRWIVISALKDASGSDADSLPDTELDRVQATPTTMSWRDSVQLFFGLGALSFALFIKFW